jgi:uncharacterized protein YqfA (UPF0365 family)
MTNQGPSYAPYSPFSAARQGELYIKQTSQVAEMPRQICYHNGMGEAANDWLIYAMVLVFLVPAGVAGVLALWALPAWLRATALGVTLPIFDVIGMKLRRIDVDLVAEAMALADQAQVDLSPVDVQRALMKRVDLRKVTLAYLQARQHDPACTFNDLVAAELSGKRVAAVQT